MSAPVATDFSQYADLRAEARAQDPAALRAAAQQFEALFTQMLLKSMRDASFGDDLMGSGQADFYRDMFDRQVAVSLSSGKGLGLADMMLRQMQPQAHAAPVVATPAALARSATPAGPVTLRAEAAPPDAPQDPADAFLAEMLPHAQKAGRALGVAPQLLLAQAALETGWGRHGPADEAGRSSHNLFGIKAGSRWGGPRVHKTTLEYEGGQARPEQAAFRAYASAAASFEDYARLVGEAPRYAGARGAGDDAARFARGLVAGGYATDPAYAEKIRSIAEDPAFRARLARAQGIEV